MAIWERNYSKNKTENMKECRVSPKINEDNAAFFRLQTEMRTDMLNNVRKEGTERIEADIKLREEMHTFGMVATGSFDKDTKMIRFKNPTRRSLSVPVRVQTAIETWNPTATTEAVLLEKDTYLYFFPTVINLVEDGTLCTGMTGNMVHLDEDELFTAKLRLDRGILSGEKTKATLTINLSTAYYKGGVTKFPVIGSPITINVDLNDLEFFK